MLSGQYSEHRNRRPCIIPLVVEPPKLHIISESDEVENDTKLSNRTEIRSLYSDGAKAMDGPCSSDPKKYIATMLHFTRKYDNWDSWSHLKVCLSAKE